ncbi:hypothetical protein [Desulfosporosinus sp.]|uniref:hypothetical protein n=1 Tax=Desulfosporosinus sp. TaxID=157907 RepID=UPI0026090A67|nr:hypothetical protein [Desulfosporosinus sp.]
MLLSPLRLSCKGSVFRMVTLPLLYIKKSFLLSLGGAAANSEVSNHSQISLSVGDIIDFG